MHQADGDDGTDAVRNRAVIPDCGRDNDPTDKEDDNELKRRKLPAGPQGKCAHHEEQEEVADDGMDNGVHGTLGHHENACCQRIHGLLDVPVGDQAHGEVGESRISGLQRKLD